MRRIGWPALAAAALVIVVAAIIVLRGTAPYWPARPAGVARVPAAPPTANSIVRARPPAKPPHLSATPATPPPSFDVVTVDPHGQAVIAGRAAPGDRVRVLNGGKVIGEVTADQRGEWVLVPDKPIAAGNQQLTLEATGKEGGAVRRSKDVVALSVAPSPSAGKAASTLAVLLPGDASRPARILQRPEAQAPGQNLSLDTAELGTDDRLVLSGQARPGARLNIYGGDRLLGTATADQAGKWSFTAPHRLPAASVELRVDELTANGSVGRRDAQLFEPPSAPTAAREGTYIVRRGNSLWLIAREIYGEGTRYTAIYAANHAEIHDPNLIYPGQRLQLPKP